MDKIQKDALLKPELLEKLSELFPQAFVDGKIDFNLLRSLLGKHVEESNEKYQFTWNGKQHAIANAQKPSIGTLREDKQSSKNFANTENLYIEGDNLEVLKLLQKTYQGKIKMIYIDPPYNTGNDFVYKDDFKDNIKNYLEQTKQANKSNAETYGRYHTDWLNMMYPRLMLARNLLSEDGVIFISIDDNEQSNLKKMCDEIFGEMNFISELVWANHEGGGSSDSKFFKIKHEYILCYCKNILKMPDIVGMEVEDQDRYKLSDNYVLTRGMFQLVKLSSASIQYSQSLDYGILSPDGNLIYPADNSDKEKSSWRWSKHKFEWGVKNDFVVFKKDTSGKWQIYTKQYLNCDNEGNIIKRTKKPLGIINQYSSTQGSKKLFELLGSNIFSYPKPEELLTWLIERIQFKPNDFILDFFSGSGTTAHAVMKLNAEDGGNRKFIMVQLPETTSEDSEAYKAGYKNICEIGKERIRRAGEKIKQEMLEKDPAADVKKLDVGFKVFKLDTTNIKPWDGTQEISDGLLDASKDVVKEDREPLDVVYELMLMYGVFNEPIEEIKINGKTMYSIANHFLMICLFEEINEKDIKEIIKLSPKNIIFNDAGFKDDNVKLNAELTLKNHGVEDIKSL